MLRTTIHLDEKLYAEAAQIATEDENADKITKKDVIVYGLFDLFSGEEELIDPNYDYKVHRGGRGLHDAD